MRGRRPCLLVVGAVSENLGCWALLGLRMGRKRGRKMCFLGYIAVQGTGTQFVYIFFFFIISKFALMLYGTQYILKLDFV